MMTANMWECDCGHIEYGKYPPEECPKCWKTNSFVEIPEDVAEEMKDQIFEKMKMEKTNEDEEEEIDEVEELL